MSSDQTSITANASNIRLRKTLNGLGGAMLNEEVPQEPQGIFPHVSGAEAQSGNTMYWGGYIYNNHPTAPLRNVIAYLIANTASANDEIGVNFDPAAVNTDIQIIANPYTAPANVEFKYGATRELGAILEQEIPPLGRKGIWLERKMNPNTESKENNEATLAIDITRTDIATPDKTVICAIGNMGCSTTFRKLWDFITVRNPARIITLGNNSMEDTADCWLNIVAPMKSRMLPTYGVDDIETDTLFNQYKNYFGNTGSWYVVQDNVAIIVMNTNFLHTEGSTGYDRVKNWLIKASQNAQVDWIIVAMHKSFWAVADEDDETYVSANLRDDMAPLFNKYGVHLVLHGMQFNYQRHHALEHDADDGGDPIIHGRGSVPNYRLTTRSFEEGAFIDIVMGCGGEDLDDFRENAAPDYNHKKEATKYGYLYLEFYKEENDKVMKGRMYGLNDDTFDSFSITQVAPL